MYNFALTFFFVFVFSFLISFYLIPIFSKVAFKFGVVDVPDGKLKKHNKATPYLGGVAIYLGFLISSALALPFGHQFFLYIMASTILLFVGLLDDLVNITPSQKFFGQFVAVLCYLKAGFYLKMSFFGNAWNIFISAFWFLLLINAFNLIDVMDGLVATIAIVIASIYIVFSLLLGQYILSLLLIAFLGALIAFLLFNKPPAKIYLGDSGSLFIGGFLASIPFGLSWSEYNSIGYIIPIVLCAIPLIEEASLILVRSFKRIPFYYGSPDHFSIYLQEKGWSKRAILVFSFVLTLFLGLISLLFFYSYIDFAALLAIGIFMLFGWYFLLL